MKKNVSRHYYPCMYTAQQYKLANVMNRLELRSFRTSAYTKPCTSRKMKISLDVYDDKTHTTSETQTSVVFCLGVYKVNENL